MFHCSQGASYPLTSCNESMLSSLKHLEARFLCSEGSRLHVSLTFLTKPVAGHIWDNNIIHSIKFSKLDSEQ